MENLFIEKQAKPELGAFHISPDPTHWIADIISHFLSKYPFLQEVPLSIE